MKHRAAEGYAACRVGGGVHSAQGRWRQVEWAAACRRWRRQGQQMGYAMSKGRQRGYAAEAGDGGWVMQRAEDGGGGGGGWVTRRT